MMDSMALTNEVAMSGPVYCCCIPMAHLHPIASWDAHFFTGCQPASPSLTLVLGQMNSVCYQLGFWFIPDSSDARTLDDSYSFVEIIFTSVLEIHFREHGSSFLNK